MANATFEMMYYYKKNKKKTNMSLLCWLGVIIPSCSASFVVQRVWRIAKPPSLHTDTNRRKGIN